MLWTDVVNGAPAPALASLHADAQASILALVEREIDASVWGGANDPSYLRVKLLRAAELGQGALDAQANAAGPVTGRSMAGVTKSMATIPAIGMGESTTRWGAELRALLRNSPARAGLLI